MELSSIAALLTHSNATVSQITAFILSTSAAASTGQQRKRGRQRRSNRNNNTYNYNSNQTRELSVNELLDNEQDLVGGDGEDEDEEVDEMDCGSVMDDDDGSEDEDDDVEQEEQGLFPSSTTQVLAGDDIWAWQYQQELNVFQQLPAEIVLQHPEDTDSDIQLAIAQMWEPNRNAYGSHSWWAWDQEQDYIPLESGSPLAPEFSVGQTFTVTELLQPVSSSSSSKSRKRTRKSQQNESNDDDTLIGMEVDRDAIYDESELTPQEIEIQRFSIAYKAKRAAELAQEHEQTLQSQYLKKEQDRVALELALHQQSYSFKSETYASVYGSVEAAELIIEMEADLQGCFEESGGIGSVPLVIPVGLEPEVYRDIQRTHQKRTLLKSEAMRRRKVATVVEKAADIELEEGEEQEEVLEEGQVQEDGADFDENDFCPISATRVLWPVLPIRK